MRNSVRTGFRLDEIVGRLGGVLEGDDGSLVVTQVATLASAQAGQVVTLQVHKGNPGAQRLYERHGFAVVGQTDTHVRLQTISAQTSPLELVAQDGNLWPTSEIPHSDAAS